MLARLVAVLLAAVWLAAPAIAEVNQVRFARQLGLGYLQFYIMEDKKLVEKHARQLGLGAVTTQWLALGTPTALNDALLTGNVDIIGVGLPAFLTLWDKTRRNADVKAMVALNRQPAYLNTRDPNIKSVRDFTDKDRIAVPAPKVSVQAIMLEMIAEKNLRCGQVRRARPPDRRHEPPRRNRRPAVWQARNHRAFHLGAVPVPAA